MTGVFIVADLRRRVASLESITPALPPQSGASRGEKSARLAGLVFRIYGFLSARRQKLLPLTTCASDFVDRLLFTAPFGATLLRFTLRRLDRRSAFAAAAARLLLIALAATAQIHLAASRKPNAMRSIRLLNLIFRDQVRARRGLASSAYFSTLALCSAYDRIMREMPQTEAIDSFAINFAAGIAHMYRHSYPAALHFLAEAAAASGNSNALRRLGCVYLLMGDYPKAAESFQASVDRDPRSVMAHQNYAAGYDATAYHPCRWELENAGELLIYDNLIQLGESFYHQGRYEDTMRCYQAALDYQDILARKWSIPDALVERISASNANFKVDQPVRLLGYEWVTMIGHIGFIDCHLRMVELGILPCANYVLLAPREKVVNSAFLALFASKLTVIEDPGLVDELLPYQRLVGDQFIAVRGNGPLAEPWAHAAARTQVKWAETRRGPLVTIPQDLLRRGRARLRAAGVTANWFVALHIREGGYHGDGPGTTRQHRSASVGDYLDAIAQVTSRGGAVVRLGDKSMTPLKGLPGVFDYAHSYIKSAEMDLFLCAQARLFVGTTSGLTTAVQALGTPMLLVNCISNDCQFWHDKTDFTLRLVRDRRANRYLSLRETYRQPVQSLLIDTALLARRDLEIHANRPQDIAEAVAYKLDYLDGKAKPLHEHGDLLSRYQRAMRENPYNFGAALPVPGFIENHLELIVTERRGDSRTSPDQQSKIASTSGRISEG
jgi:putative glycosyltransferase (TIGR04372 family)